MNEPLVNLASQAPTVDEPVLATEVDQGMQVGGFRLVQELRRDSAVATYLAVESQLSRQAIVKIMPAAAATDSDVGRQRDLLLAGARRAALLSDRASPPILDIGGHGDWAYVARGFADGRSLESLMQQRSLGARQCVEIVASAAAILRRLHGQGIPHGNLKPSNLILAGDSAGTGQRDWLTLVDFRGQGQGLMIDDVRSLGRLLADLLHYARRFGPAATHDSPAAIADPYLDRICQTAMNSAGADSPAAVGQFAEDLAIWKERVVDGAWTGKKLRRGFWPWMMAIAAAALLLVSAFLLLGHAVLLATTGVGHIGPVVFSSVIMAGLPLVCGCFLAAAARRGLAPQQNPNRNAAPEGMGDRPQSLVATEAAPGASTTTPAAERAAASELLAGVSELLGRTPRRLRVTVEGALDSVTIRYWLGSAVGNLVAAVSLAIFGVAIVRACSLAADIGRAAWGPLAIGAAALLVCLAAVLWITERWVARPYRHRTGGWPRLLQPVRRETLTLTNEELTLRLGKFRAARKTIPWAEIWDIREGNSEEGLDVATLGGIVRFGAGLDEETRGWIARLARLFQMLASQPAATGAAPEGGLVVRRAAAEGKPVWRIMAVAGAVFVVAVTAVEAIAGLDSPSALAPRNPWGTAELLGNDGARLAMLVSTVFFCIGAWRMAQGRASGYALICLGFLLRCAWLVLIYVFVAFLRRTEETVVVLTPSVNLGAFFSGVCLWGWVALVCAATLGKRHLRLKHE